MRLPRIVLASCFLPIIGAGRDGPLESTAAVPVAHRKLLQPRTTARPGRWTHPTWNRRTEADLRVWAGDRPCRLS
jgi:hypothetical protein